MNQAVKGDTFSRLAQRTKISDIRRNELTSAALRCIVDKGYDRVTLDDVAKESGFSQGIVLYYFKNRESLLSSAVERIWRDLLDITRKVWELPEDGDERKRACKLIKQHYSDPEIDLAAVIRNGVKVLLDWFEDNPHFLTVALELFCQVPRNPVIAELRDMIQPFLRTVTAAFIEVGMKRGAFRKRNSLVAAHMLLSAITGLAFAHVTTRKGEFDLKKLEGDLCDLIFGYLGP